MRRRETTSTLDHPKSRGALPPTFYATPERARGKDLRKAVTAVSHNPAIDVVMQSFGGLIAVLNEYRQIVAVNSTMLHLLGIDDATKALGLRTGEAIGCIHANDHPGGCGTSQYCSTCGSAIAIVTALETNAPQERECILTVRRGRKELDIDFAVRCRPIEIEGFRLLLLLLRDISEEKRRGALERMFFHDISNLLLSLDAASDLLALEYQNAPWFKPIHQTIALLVKEVEVQRALSKTVPGKFRLSHRKTTVYQILGGIRMVYENHPAAAGTDLRVIDPPEDVAVTADITLVLRVLMNMVTNALEDTSPGNEVRVWTQAADGTVTFFVWNEKFIPPKVALRIFQRYFTTKSGFGRGLGTYTMKWLAEKCLNGKVAFTSTEAEGTTFRLCIPESV